MKKLLITIGAVIVSAGCSFAHLGHTYAQMASGQGNPGTSFQGGDTVWIVPQYQEQIWAHFNSGGYCDVITYFFDSLPPPEFMGLAFIGNFGKGIKWNDWQIGPVHYWRDANNPKNSVMFVPPAANKTGKYMIQMGNN